MGAEQKIKKTLDGNSDASAFALCPNIEGLYSLIPLTQGKFAIVDNEDFERLNQYKWHIYRKAGKFLRGACRFDNKTKTAILMHREIMKAPPNMQVDHINHNVFDNRKTNLRLCTNSQNAQNQRPKIGYSSKYKGVAWYKRRKKWRALIEHNHHSIFLGLFDNEIAAAKAYDKKAKELFGKFAYTNF